MRKINIANIAAALACVLSVSMPAAVSAQVSKSVEVTKTFEADFTGAMKLPVEADMSDTDKMQPDIVYGITPSMYPTDLSTHRFEPAKVTYWEFNRPTNFYLKMGIGYPLNTVADLYASMHDARTGYIMAYANHLGQFGKLKNDLGIKRDCLQAKTLAGAAGGVYWGKRMFEGRVEYISDVNRRYASAVGNPMAEYEDFGLKLRLGDDFVDLSRINFNIELHGDYFHDKSDWVHHFAGTGDASYKLQQFDFGFAGRVARRFGRHYTEILADYDGYRGTKTLKGYVENMLRVGLRYGYTPKSGVVDLTVGADYVYDRVKARDKASHYVFPYAKLLFNVSSNGGIIPFVEVDGSVHDNSYRSLAFDNPYVEFWEGRDSDTNRNKLISLPATVDYNLRAGIEGKFGRGKVGYRLFANMAFFENSIYWYSCDHAWARLMTARRDVLTLNLELEYSPTSPLTLSAGVRGRIFKDYAEIADYEIGGGESPVDGFLKVRYKHRKFSVGAYAKASGATEWCNIVYGVDENDPTVYEKKNERFGGYVDLGVNFEMTVKEGCSVFLEGANLANMKIYHFAHYREQGIRCTAGVKLTF